MKSRTPRLPATIQLNLPLLQGRTCLVPADKQAELVLVLVELLIGAAHGGRNGGDDDESEAHR